MARLTSIVMHWTGGGYVPNAVDRRAYHLLIDGDGRAVQGDHAPEANLSTADGRYAAHFAGGNTGRIGVAVCAMHKATEVPFDWGVAPLRPVQVAALVREVAQLCLTYDIPVTRETVFTHAEAHGWRGKWDISALPEVGPVSAAEAGNHLRGRIAARVNALRAHGQPARMPAPAGGDGWLAALIDTLRSLIAGLKGSLK